MKANSRIRFAIIAILVIVGMMFQIGVPTPAHASPPKGVANQTGGEIRQEVTLTIGESAVRSQETKLGELQQDTDKLIPDLDTPPIPPDSPKEPHDTAAPTRDRGWNVMMNETFEGAFPTGLWDVFDNNGTAYGEYYWDDDDYKPFNGWWSAWPANGGANALDPQFYNYPNYMDSWMVYGPFDLSGCASADFDFWYWNQSEAGFDYFSWTASPNGTNFYGWGVSGDSGGWHYEDLNLAPYLGDTSVWLGFIFQSDYSIVDDGPFVDDVRLWCYTETNVRPWTFMVYLDGDNNLESAAIDDFLEMSSVGSDANVNIVVEMDRIGGYDAGYDDWTDTRRYYVTPGMTPTVANSFTSVGEANMGDPETLLNFVRWGKAFAPADHYVLVLWDHGSGWKLRDPDEALIKGISFDDTSGGDSIDMPELRDSLNTLTNAGAQPFDIVGLDACLMAMIEVDNQIKPYANIRVGSEEVEPGDGWPYNTILASLVANPSMSAATLAANIVDFYYASYGNDQTQSAVDLGTPYSTLNTAVNNLAVALMDHGANHIAEIQHARDISTEFTDTDFIDLWDFADYLRLTVGDSAISSAALAVENAVLAAVIREWHGPAWPWARGISIYYPEQPAWYDGRYDGGSGFLQFTASTQWDEWIHTFHNFANYPTMFNKSSPADGATGQSMSPTLSWNASAGATSYDYCYDTINDGVCSGSWMSAGAATSVTPSLAGGTTYYWQVRANNGYGSVEANNGAMWSFTTVLPCTSFDSQFNGTIMDWSSVVGTWINYKLRYLRSAGLPYVVASARHTGLHGNFTYEALMKRSGGCTSCANRLIIRGDATNNWVPSYLFQYSNLGTFSVYEITSGGSAIALADWTSSLAIAKKKWNTLRVVANGSSLSFYINGYLVWSGSDSTLTFGTVGLGFYRDNKAGKLDVDWARLSCASPGTIPGIPEEVMAGEVIPGGDVNQSP